MTTEQLQQAYDLAKEINDLLQQIDNTAKTVNDKLPELEKTGWTAQEATRVIFRLNHVFQQMGLPPEIDSVLAKFQRLIFIARMLQMSMNFLEAGTGYGLIMGGLGFVSSGLAFFDSTVGAQ